MDLELITFAEKFYQSRGYQKIDVPWAVDKEVLDITLPVGKKGADLLDKKLVGSAEQSYLQLLKEKKIASGKYVATTPCFRDDLIDELHQHYFLKTELIHIDLQGNLGEKDIEKIIDNALEFFGFLLPVKKQQTDIGYDIVDEKLGIELGSYGTRQHQFSEDYTVQWAYGTGIALPRLTYVIEKTRRKGYHETIIPKVPAGSFFKILEETEEATDAHLTRNPIMLLAELSDLYGAMELFLEQEFPSIDMNDIKTMNRMTRRAFQNGRR
ncbi:MAG TPA: hypothetical protein VJI32_06440 [Candidatus Nanoarchaeia archaeon]|nr:hypothetical protein [Candidatus Nanoarchaeia archaeon]